jgi:general secretion pathway protein C
LVRIGVMLGDHELVAIRRGWIVLAESTKFECVEIGGAKRRPSRYGASSASKSSSSKSKKSKKNKYKEGIKKTGKGSYDIDKNSLNEWLDDIGTLSRQARVIPHYRGGKPQGFKIVGVRPGSLYTNLGIRSGDILKSVNGEEVTSPTKALELYEKLKTSDNVTLDIERRGRKATYEYNIK